MWLLKNKTQKKRIYRAVGRKRPAAATGATSKPEAEQKGKFTLLGEFKPLVVAEPKKDEPKKDPLAELEKNKAAIGSLCALFAKTAEATAATKPKIELEKVEPAKEPKPLKEAPSVKETDQPEKAKEAPAIPETKRSEEVVKTAALSPKKEEKKIAETDRKEPDTKIVPAEGDKKE